MKNPSPREISFIASAALAVFVFLSLIAVNLFLSVKLEWYFIFAISIVNFFISYFIFNYFLQRFIYRKIKLIYKNIHRLKADKDAKPLNVDLSEDIISDVEHEVLDWAEGQTKEIEDLKKMATFRKEFIGNVSHELKTPIFAAQGYLHTLIDGGIEDNKINKNYLYKTSKNLDRLNHIVEDLEVISKYESDTLNLNVQKFDIEVLIAEVMENLEMQADIKDIKLKFKTETPKLVFVKADRERIRQVLSNLTTNSIKYGNDGGETTYSIYDMDKNILIEVTDNGIGIDSKHIPRLFERFYRVDKSRSRDIGGTGLGLAIVKHIVEAHQQTITARSKVGVGSTFGFTLTKA